ncbi:GPW/gp25 family protein [Laribacter hongkongensis]|uniref:GPW/gp25 family protein n=1 Tax=Laribacter hongkongensis TaxID=168471 RepID=UPI001EFD72BD|nr:GPW/gp25 family protein [Laribacter hongkongensis]MCG9100459.1 GPW/gp25 family protein [Laribacter hongkongensis]MCG9113306.1 GPW/gp25 family protein [Laribacter hongkongensis]
MTARYLGLNAATGSQISDLDHIRQSIGKILTTPIGSRVMRRDFGSLAAELIDAPHHPKTTMQIMAAAVMAISQWEPRVSLAAISINSDGPVAVADLTLIRRDGPDAGNRAELRIPFRG